MISSLHLYGVNDSFPLKSAFVSLGFYKKLYLCLIDNIVRYQMIAMLVIVQTQRTRCVV